MLPHAEMIALIQRVTDAGVTVDGECIASIGNGLLVLVGVEKRDSAPQADRLLERILGYRVFPDESQRMNLSVSDTGGGLLLVPQFTLAADTCKGMRPGFASAAPPREGEHWFDYLAGKARQQHRGRVETGKFGADMKVALINDGPVTFWLNA